MTTFPKIVSTARIARLKLFFGSAVIFASMTAAGQAESLYPQPVPLAQTADAVRPTARPYQNKCTILEREALMTPAECGTLTLNDVVKRVTAIRDADNSK
jgi:hypothetical protein